MPRFGSKTPNPQFREGRHFKTTEAKRHTFGEMIGRYRKNILPQKSAIMQTEQYRQLEWWNEQHCKDAPKHISNQRSQAEDGIA